MAEQDQHQGTPEGEQEQEQQGSQGTPQEQESQAPSFGEVDEVLDAMRFDPFAKKEEGDQGEPGAQQPGSEGQPSGASPGEADGGAQEPGKQEQEPGAQPAQPTAEPPKAEESAEFTLLRQQLQNVTQQLQQMQQQGAQPQAQPSAQNTTQEIAQKYAYQMPQELISKMRSEDPAEFAQGLQAYTQGLATQIHSNVVKEFEDRLQNTVPQMIHQQTREQQQAKTLQDDFYGTYPQLNRPELYPLVQQVAVQVMQETGAQQWTPQLRDTIAQRMVALLGGSSAPAPATPAPAAVPQPTPNNGSGGGQPFMAGSGRPHAPETPRDPNGTREIADMLGL